MVRDVVTPKTDNLIQEFRQELHTIADWWCQQAPDPINGGFIGEITRTGVRQVQSNKGVILNARLLWFFSELAQFTGNLDYRELATRAYQVIAQQFLDKQHGGLVWAVNYRGQVIDSRKQVYAQAFGIYGLCAYYQLTHDQNALELAIELFNLVENYAHPVDGEGYLEAFSQNWQALSDTRLSEKDLHAHKSMNTHLHILEAYGALTLTGACPLAAQSLRRLICYFYEHILDKQTWHLRLFQNCDWTDISEGVSYGHDIECSWLLWESARRLQDKELQQTLKPVVLNIANNLRQKGIDQYGALQDGFSFTQSRPHQQRIWWVQSEALVGFLTAYQISGDSAYRDSFLNVWKFIKNYIKDSQNGEWHWFSTLDQPQWQEYKLGFWKGPYHNGRAMMEVCKLLLEVN